MSHHHPDNVRVDVGWRDLGVMQKLLEERRARKVAPRIELLLAKNMAP